MPRVYPRQRPVAAISRPLLISMHQACALLGMKEATLLRERERGRFPPVVRVGRSTRVRLVDFKAYVERLATLEEREEYVQRFGGITLGGIGQHSLDRWLLAIMLRLREGWRPKGL